MGSNTRALAVPSSAGPTAIAPDRIATVEVLATVVGGRVAHDRMGLG